MSNSSRKDNKKDLDNRIYSDQQLDSFETIDDLDIEVDDWFEDIWDNSIDSESDDTIVPTSGKLIKATPIRTKKFKFKKIPKQDEPEVVKCDCGSDCVYGPNNGAHSDWCSLIAKKDVR